MSEDESWPRRHSRKKRPLFGDWFLEDVDEAFREIEQELGEIIKNAPRDFVRERVLPDGSKTQEWGPFVYGYSVTIGSDGKPQIREFGNMKPRTRLGRPRIDIKEEREPLVDVMTTDGEVKVIIELPGVEKKDIILHGTGNSLAISVDTPQHKYYKEVELPVRVDPKQAKSKYNNGVLEVTLQKRKVEKPKGERIKID